MIGKNVQQYCSEDISHIENYTIAHLDTTQMWECHHRLETDADINEAQLKFENRYYNRPASELIFLTRTAHKALHKRHIEQQIFNRKQENKQLRKKYKKRMSLEEFWTKF